MFLRDYICPRRSDPFYIASYYINGSLLLGHTVLGKLQKGGAATRRGGEVRAWPVSSKKNPIKNVATKLDGGSLKKRYLKI